MKKNILTIGLLVSLLAVGALTNNARKEENALEVRDVLVEDFGNEASGRLVRREANEVASNKLSNVKAQISSVTETNTRHIRFVAALDSYLYEEVSFTITASNGEETKTLVDNEVVTTAYTHVEANEATLSASEAFGEGYTYLVAYTINNVPESAWGFSFSATVSARATGYDESVSQSATRVISDMIAIEDEMTPIERVDAELNFNYENGAVFTKGADRKPEFTVSEGADYTYHFYCEAKDQSFETYEELEAGYSYSLVVVINENNLYNYKRDFRWFTLTNKVKATVEFNYANGAVFTKGAEEKPEFTISEGADYTYHFYCEDKKQSFETYEELEAGYSYSLVVVINENDLYVADAGTNWRWFTLKAAPTVERQDAEVTFNYSAGTSFVVGSDERPTVTVSEGAEYVVTYSSDATGYNSEEYPTEPGTYSLVVTIKENDKFNGDKKWLWFKLVAE